ncbi:aquaporin [Candidatus Microgenomates bacterium]|nr:aquaporin [Candidatus Microgenomates bacterium]
MKKILSEFIGTLILSLVVFLSLTQQFFIPTPILAALVLTLFVFTIGGISGCHLNPAVTIGLWSLKKIDRLSAIKYIIGQLLAGLLIFLIHKKLNLPFPAGSEIFITELLFELLGMIIFTFGIAAVVYKSVPDEISGFVVGGSLLLGITLSALGGGAGILNPAVGVGLGVSHIEYYAVEIVGSILGFQLYKYLQTNKK